MQTDAPSPPQMAQELFFEIRREKSHYYLDTEDNKSVRDLKNMLAGITHLAADHMELWKLDEDGRKMHSLHDSALLSECGYTNQNAKAQSPAAVGLRVNNLEEHLSIVDVSTPPPIPDTMRQDPPVEN